MAKDRIATKKQLFEVALDLFRKNGYDHVSISEICEKANVTRNAFYYNYNGKEDLLHSYFENVFNMQSDLFATLIALPDDWQKLWALFKIHLVQMLTEGPDLARQLLWVNLQSKNGIVNKYFLTDAWCVPLFRNCQNAGIIRSDLPAEQLNFLAFRLQLGMLLTWCAAESDFDLIGEAYEGLCILLEVKQEYRTLTNTNVKL